MIKTSASITVQYDNIFSPFSGKDWRKGFRWVKESGFDAVEIILADPNLLSAEEILREAMKNGLGISTISTGQAAAMEGLSMMSASREVRERTVKRLMDDIDFSVELGRPNVTIGLIRGVGGLIDRGIEYDLLKRETLTIADYAAKRGVRLNMEAINRYEVRHLNAMEETAVFLRDIGEPESVGILYDTFHSNIEDADMKETVRQYAGMISHVHFADSNRRLPGEGHIDFPGIIRTLEKADYHGFVSLEVLNTPSRDHIIENAGRNIGDIIRRSGE